MGIFDGGGEPSQPLQDAEVQEEPSLYSELLHLLTSVDVYFAAAVLAVGLLTPEALPQHQRGEPGSGPLASPGMHVSDHAQKPQPASATQS